MSACCGGPAILLGDGTVLIAHARRGPDPANAELYDPIAGTFARTYDQVVPWGGAQAATLLPDGNVLLVICCMAEQLYNPPTATFSFTGRTTRINSDGFGAAQLANGTALFTGGYAEEGASDSRGAELYDPASGLFIPTGDMTVGRFYHTTTPLGDATLLIAGGRNSSYLFLKSAEIYDPSTGAFFRTNDMNQTHYEPTATLLPDGTVLIAGGWLPDGPVGGAELYIPSAPVSAPVLSSTVWHATTGEPATPSKPAVAGEVLSILTTSLVDGGLLPPQVSVGGRLAEVLSFGVAPDKPGSYLVNFRVPTGIASSPAISVRLSYLGRFSNPVTLVLQ
jgi:hypothetical protein